MGRIDTAEMDGAGSRPVFRAELETEPALLKGREAKSWRTPSRTTEPLATPMELRSKVPGTDTARKTVAAGREAVRQVLAGKDQRLLVVAGPCSVHDEVAALDYAGRLRALSDRVSDTLLLVMRAYVEKPRTHLGWKGLALDPRLDGSDALGEGLLRSRRLFTAINAMGLPVATEFVGPATPAYVGDLVSWAAIGARTTESQTHREMSSGLSMAIGFKNGTDGSLGVAVNAMNSVSHPHSFLGINQQGQVSIIRTRGNNYGHVVLRGGGGKPNYDSVNVALCEQALEKAKLRKSIMVDCSHANSSKDPAIQPLMIQDIAHQILESNQSIQGLMVESHLNWGNQSIPENLDDLKYGVSITDACIDWDTTEKALREMREKLKDVLPGRKTRG